MKDYRAPATEADMAHARDLLHPLDEGKPFTYQERMKYTDREFTTIQIIADALAVEREKARAAIRASWAAALRSEMQPDTSWDYRDVDDLADALLPVVDRIASERAAAELEAAADYWDRPTVRTVAADLRQRAIALRAVK